MTDHSAFVRRYLGAISAGATGPALAAYYDPEAIQEEFPNRLTPNGASRNLAALLEGAERGKKVLSGQTFDIRAIMAGGDRVAVEAIWTGKLAIPIGNLKAGDEMKARFAMFFEMRNGKIYRQRNYDCFDPF
jgi:ketosteroid isomerase-like protein